MSESNAAIIIDGISKEYQLGGAATTFREALSGLFAGKKRERESFWALKNISFRVDEGETVGIIGRNGAGKSTLLKILSKITLPTNGEVRINGQVSSLLEVGTGFHPELTGRENIFLNGSILGMTRKEIEAKLDEIIAFSGIEKFLDTPVKRYSSGMYVRLAFAVAAHLEPEILIVDEVLSVGDAEFQKKCMGKLDSVAASGRTVLFVSHNLEAVRKMCTRTVWLEQGQIKKIGASDEVIRAYLSEMQVKSEHVKPGHRTDRMGSGELKVEDVRIHRPEGGMIESGAPLQIDVEYSGPSHEKLACVATLGVFDDDGRRLFTLSTKFAQKLVELQAGDVLSWSIPRLSLTPGRYALNAFIAHRTESDILDWIQQVATFEVKASRFFSNSDEQFYAKDRIYVDHKFEVS